jgi:predicted DCC family thiol-disulfide oxidoreductase YuxK
MSQIDHGPSAEFDTGAPRPPAPVTVFYDGSCPICTWEVGLYRGQPGAESIRWLDVSRCAEGDVVPGLSRAQALARFHVQDGAGRLVDGGRAFAVLWSALPRFAPMGRVLHRPPFVWLLNVTYDLFLRIRPRVQARVARRSSSF